MSKSLLILLFLLIHSWTYSQNMPFGYRTYDADEGMLSSQVYCVLKDKKGFMWFGSDIGISKFDGYDFINFTKSDGLTGISVFNLNEDQFGRIWYTTFKGGLGYIEDDIVKPYPYNDVFLENCSEKGWINQMHVMPDGAIRFNLTNKTVGEIDRKGALTLNSNIIAYPLLAHSNDSLPMTFIEQNDSLFLDGSGYDRKLLYCKPSVPLSCATYPISDDASFFQYSNLVGYVDSDTLLTRIIYNQYLSAGCFDHLGRLWLSVGSNGVKIYNSIYDFFENKEPIFHFLKNLTVSQFRDDDNGGMWITAANSGIYHVYNYEIENYELEGEVKLQTSCLAGDDKEGVFYASLDGGVVYLDSIGNWFSFCENEIEIRQMEKLDSNHFMYATFHDNKNYLKSEFGLNMIRVLGRGFLKVNDSVNWVIESTSVVKMLNDSIVFRSSGNNFYRKVAVDEKGRVWFGGSNGLSYYEGNRLLNANQLIGKENTTVSVKDFSILNNDVLLVVSANNGVYFLIQKDSTYTSYNIPLKDCVLEKGEFVAKDSTLWLASRRGVLKMKFNVDLTYELTEMNTWKGLASNEVNDIELVGDYVYAATNNGLSKFHKNDLSKYLVFPKLYINSFLANQEEYISKEGMILKHFQNNIEISFTGISFRMGERTMYKYRLVGLDEPWQYGQARKVRYPSLTPGSYQFLVAVSNEDGVWSEYETVSFYIKKPVWKTWWFVTIGLTLIIIIVVFIYKRKVEKRKITIQKERETELNKRKIIEAKLFALRSQMNPHFIFNALNAIQNVMINFSVKEATTYMANFSILLRKILESSEKSSISIDEELEMLKLYVELENLRFNNSIQFVVDLDPSIDADFEKIPVMIIQPFVENAIIHGVSGKRVGEKKIEIRVKLIEDELTFIIRDNGIGRAESKRIKRKGGIEHQSFGIKITEERLRLLGNSEGADDISFKIVDCYDEDQIPNGTQVEIIFKKNSKINE